MKNKTNESKSSVIVHVRSYSDKPDKTDTAHVQAGVSKYNGTKDGFSDKGAYFKFSNSDDAESFRSHIDQSPNRTTYADIIEESMKESNAYGWFAYDKATLKVIDGPFSSKQGAEFIIAEIANAVIGYGTTDYDSHNNEVFKPEEQPINTVMNKKENFIRSLKETKPKPKSPEVPARSRKLIGKNIRVRGDFDVFITDLERTHGKTTRHSDMHSSTNYYVNKQGYVVGRWEVDTERGIVYFEGVLKPQLTESLSSRIKNNPAVSHLDDERSEGNSIIVTLKKGYEWESDPGCGVRGFDSMKEAYSDVMNDVRKVSDIKESDDVTAEVTLYDDEEEPIEVVVVGEYVSDPFGTGDSPDEYNLVGASATKDGKPYELSNDQIRQAFEKAVFENVVAESSNPDLELLTTPGFYVFNSSGSAISGPHKKYDDIEAEYRDNDGSEFNILNMSAEDIESVEESVGNIKNESVVDIKELSKFLNPLGWYNQMTVGLKFAHYYDVISHTRPTKYSFSRLVVNTDTAEWEAFNQEKSVFSGSSIDELKNYVASANPESVENKQKNVKK